MTRLRAIVRKEFRHIARDPLSLGMLVFVPALLLLLYGYALSFDVKHIRLAVLDRSRSPASRELLDSLFRNPYFDRAAAPASYAEAGWLLTRGAVRAALVIPPDYARAVARGEQAPLQVLLDGADANSASTARGYLDAVADRTTRRLAGAALARAGQSPSLPFVQPEPRVWFNPELKSARFLVPGLIGLILMLSAVIATSLSIVREKERETIDQLRVSPVQPEELVLGKTLPYVVVCLATMAFILLIGRLCFGVTVRGSLGLLAVSTLFFLFAAIGMGVFISSVTRSQQVAFQIAIITSLLPSILLSGLVFPIANMPLPLQALTHVVVPRYFVHALRGIILKGAGVEALWRDWAGLLALGLLFNLLAARSMRRTAD